MLYSAADALLAAAIGFCLRQFAPERPGAGMLLVGAAAAAALGSVQLWQLQPGVIACAALELYLCSKAQVKAALAASAVLGAALCAADPALSFAAAGLACAHGGSSRAGTRAADGSSRGLCGRLRDPAHSASSRPEVRSSTC